MDPFWTVGLASVISVIVYCLVTKSNKKSSLHNAPPCLPSLPIIGSLPFLGDAKKLHINLLELTKKYGNIFGLYLGSRYRVVLNGKDAIREALSHNDSSFADRGKAIVYGTVLRDTGKEIILHTYNNNLKDVRSYTISVLHTLSLGRPSTVEFRIQAEAKHLIQYISTVNGKDFNPGKVLACAAQNVMFSILFGERLEYDSELSDFLISAAHSFANSAATLYEIFPIIMKFPHHKNQLDQHKETYNKWLSLLENRVAQNASVNVSEKNFVAEYFKLVGPNKTTGRDLAVIIRDLMLAGTLATSIQLNWALILLANHPEVQSKLQQEIDSVVERGRLPSLDDKPRLPFLEATLLEVMRMRTALPLSIPRFTVSESIVGGYTIPAKTQVFVNLWSEHMGSEFYPDPESFRPQRFLDAKGDITNSEAVITFSFGKRSCLGEVLARQEMFLLAAAMIQNFRMLPPEGEKKVKDEMCFIKALIPLSGNLRLMPRE